MKSEPVMSAKVWLLHIYLVGCVEFYPVAVPSILCGFDLLADLTYENGAMGGRDVVDC